MDSDSLICENISQVWEVVARMLVTFSPLKEGTFKYGGATRSEYAKTYKSLRKVSSSCAFKMICWVHSLQYNGTNGMQCLLSVDYD
jgi:hypothetical protein